MKKILSGLMLVAASSLVYASPGPGCGAGAMIFKGQSGLAPHVLAATTNGSFGNQTFGMTTGTLGCNPNTAITATAAIFVDQNMEQLAADMSRGEGEYLSALMLLLKVEESDKNHFKTVMKDQFATVFSSSDVTSDQALSQLESVMKADATLAKYLG